MNFKLTNMKKKISLFNAWENREEILDRCVKAEACKTEFSRLLMAKTEKGFRDVLLDNLGWVISGDILDWEILRVYGWLSRKIEYQGEIIRIYNVDLKKPYKGHVDWWMDEYGYLVIPYGHTSSLGGVLTPTEGCEFYKYKYPK